MKHSGCIMVAFLRPARTSMPAEDSGRAADEAAGTKASNGLFLVVFDLTALRARMVIQLPHGGVKRLAQRDVHVLLSRQAIHHKFLARDCKFDVDFEPLALLLALVRQCDGHATTGNLGMKALQLCHLVTDMLFHSLRMVDSVKHDL
jgi:hypothetical protein